MTTASRKKSMTLHPTRLTIRLFASALFLAAGMAGARAASLSTDTDVTLPETIALYCYDEVDVDVGDTAYLQALGSRAGGQGTIALDASGSNGRWEATGPANAFDDDSFDPRGTVDLNLTGVCALRAMGSGSGVRVTVTPLFPFMRGPNFSWIIVQHVLGRDNALGGTWQSSYVLPDSELGFSTVRGIDIQMRLDLRFTRSPGRHSGLFNGSFIVTVVPNL